MDIADVNVLITTIFTVATDIADISTSVATIFTLAMDLMTSVTYCYYFLNRLFQFISRPTHFRVATKLFLAQKIVTSC
jgi:uncharacterized protein YoxC